MTPHTVCELDDLDDLRAAKFVPPPEEAPMAEHFLTWNGWDVFSTEDDCDSREKTKRKTSFFAVNQDTGEQRDIDISPYGYGDKHLIRRVIDLGFPSRITCAPLNHADCDRIAAHNQERTA